MNENAKSKTRSNRWMLAVGIMIGCVMGGVIGVSAEDDLPNFKPVTSITPWQQFCHRQKGVSVVQDVNAEAVKLGGQGWELVSVSVDQAWGIVACYKRPFR